MCNVLVFITTALCSLFPMGYLAPRMWYYGRLNIGNGNYLYWRQTFFRSNMTANEPLIGKGHICDIMYVIKNSIANDWTMLTYHFVKCL